MKRFFLAIILLLISLIFANPIFAQEVPDPSPSPSASVEPTPLTTPEPSSSPEPSESPIPQPSEQPTQVPSIPITNSPTVNIVSAGVIYNDSTNTVKVKFNSISAIPGSLNISKSDLSTFQADELGALSNSVYEITSSMPNGGFTYDLILPLPNGVDGTSFKVLYAASVNELADGSEVTQSITNNGDGTFTIHNLDHFTVFVVVDPNTQANCDSITVGTTPGSTCFTTIQAAVNAAANGDTINVSSTGSPYNETVYVNKQLSFVGFGNPSVTAFVLQTTPVTITGISTSVSIATPTVSLTNPVNSGNQTATTISGSGAANATVNYTITGTSGSVSGTGTVSGAGAINITGIDVSSLPEGPLTLTVNLTSGGYSSANATAASFKDTTSPAQASNLSITNPIGSSNQNSVSLSGNAEAGTSVNWSITDGTTTVSGTTSATGAGTFSVTGVNVTALLDGTLTLSTTLTDSAGNSSSSASTTSVKDTVAPSVSAGSNQVRNAIFTQTGIATDASPSSGIGTYLWSQVSGPGTVTFGSANAIVTTISASADGSYVIRLTVTDNAGNATSSTLNLTWDTTSPTVGVGANVTTNIQFSKTATATDPAPSSGISTMLWSKVSGPGNIIFSSATSLTTDISADTDGTYVIGFTVTDNAGNSTTSAFTLVWDTVAPIVSAGSNKTTNAQFTQTGTASDPAPASGIATTTWSMFSGPGIITFGTPNSLVTTVSADTDGTYVLRLTVIDNAGNSSFSDFTLTWDITSPTVSWVAPQAGSKVNGAVTLTVSTSDTNGIASTVFSYRRNDGVDTFHVTTSSWDTIGLVIDNYTLRVTVTDNGGNVTVVDQLVDVVAIIPSSSVTPAGVTKDTVIINWTTNHPTTSRVIYDTTSHSTLGAAPNYGYPSSTQEIDLSPKVINHFVSLTGLRAGTRYFYRVISAGSPESVSEEFSVKTQDETVSTSSSQGGLAGPSTCSDIKPGSAPILLAAKANARGQITLSWSKANDPVTYYLIEYGTKSGKYEFGVADVGNVTTYTIGNLNPGTTYFFRVRAGNVCAPGDFSNELSEKADGGKVLGVATKVVDVVSGVLGAEDVSAAEIDDEATTSSDEATESAESIGEDFDSPEPVLYKTKPTDNRALISILVGAGLLGVGYYFYRKQRS